MTGNTLRHEEQKQSELFPWNVLLAKLHMVPQTQPNLKESAFGLWTLNDVDQDCLETVVAEHPRIDEDARPVCLGDAATRGRDIIQATRLVRMYSTQNR
jgi:hypothetical protein